jgi:hypothetical protein
MRLIYTLTGLNNPYSLCTHKQRQKSDLRTIPISMDTSEDRVSKNGVWCKSSSYL